MPKNALSAHAALALLATALGASACQTSARMINNPAQGEVSQYGPVRRLAPQTGVVKYSADGSSAEVEQRKEDAYRQMYAACSGYYEIVAEELVQDGATSLGTQSVVSNIGVAGTTAQALSSWVVQFRCVAREPGAAPKPPPTPRNYEECRDAGGQWYLFIDECRFPTQEKSG
jgi:hypothetical protein